MFPPVSLVDFALTSVGLYAIIVFRYFLIAGLFHWLFWYRKHSFVRLYKDDLDPKVVCYEMGWSLITSIIFTLPGAYMIEAWKAGGTQIYVDLGWVDIIYYPLSMILFMLIHDTYFYWLHRFLHHPKVYRTFHSVHHYSKNPTPWAAFSFHPYEGVLEALIVPLLPFFIPIHFSALLLVLTIMTVLSVLNHSGHEIWPRSWMRGIWGKWMITATHHNIHHEKFRHNYGLYFRFWDYWMKTDRMTS